MLMVMLKLVLLFLLRLLPFYIDHFYVQDYSSLHRIPHNYVRENQTGMAIGAWLTVMQALDVTAVFFWWT